MEKEKRKLVTKAPCMTCFGKRTLLCAEPLDCLRTLLCAEPLDCLRTLLCAEPLDCLRTCPVPDPCLPDDPPPCRLPSSGPRLLSWITDWLWWQRRPAAPFPSPLTNKSLFKLYFGVEIDFVAFSPVNTPKHLECVTIYIYIYIFMVRPLHISKSS